MKTFLITQRIYEYYSIEADSEEDALDTLYGGECEPYDTGEAFIVAVKEDVSPTNNVWWDFMDDTFAPTDPTGDDHAL